MPRHRAHQQPHVDSVEHQVSLPRVLVLGRCQKPEGDGMKHEYSHALWSTIGFYLCKYQIVSNDFSSLNALHLCVCIDLHVLTKKADYHAWPPIRKAYHDDL